MTLSLKKIHFIGSKVGSSIPRLKNLNIPKSPLYEISVSGPVLAQLIYSSTVHKYF